LTHVETREQFEIVSTPLRYQTACSLHVTSCGDNGWPKVQDTFNRGYPDSGPDPCRGRKLHGGRPTFPLNIADEVSQSPPLQADRIFRYQDGQHDLSTIAKQCNAVMQLYQVVATSPRF
jgi:hypothetical protein